MAIPVETFFLSPDAEGTLQAQIRQMIAGGILSGRFRKGEKLPSSRKLAAHLGVSRITVTLALTELQASDYLQSRDRSGYYVSENAPEPPAFSDPAPRRETIDWARALGRRYSEGDTPEKPLDWARYPYPFIYGQTDPALFDHANWRHCALRALGARDFHALSADHYDRDDPKLVEFIARHILPRRGILAQPSEILITMGAQNALWLAAQVLLTQRRTAVIENPCYHALRDILNQARCALVPVDVDRDGLPPEALPDRADVIFTTPSHQAPTNATMPLARRHALLEAAAAREALIVEDDYEFEMAFLRPPLPALKSLDTEGRVIYVGSFSKSIFPGLRLGYLVGSRAFIREARALRASVLRHPPGLMQRTAAYFLSLGHYDSLIRRMARVLARRREVMEAALAREGLEIVGRGVFGGSSIWMQAPDGVDTAVRDTGLRAQGVLIEPGAPFFHAAARPRNFYRLAYSSISDERIPEGIARLARELARNA
jgi:GntR family transcriptional regulator/MocR family aminotransferase